MLTGFAPYAAPTENWQKDVKGMTNGECVIVAVAPDPIFGLKERKLKLSTYADELASETGLPTIVTEDLLSYIALCRLERHGYDEESVNKVLNRISSIQSQCFFGE